MRKRQTREQDPPAGAVGSGAARWWRPRRPSPRHHFRDRLLVGMLVVALVPLVAFAALVAAGLSAISRDTIEGTHRTILADQQEREQGLVADRSKVIDQELAQIGSDVAGLRDQATLALSQPAAAVALESFSFDRGVYFTPHTPGSTVLLSQTSPAVVGGQLDGRHHAAAIAANTSPLVPAMQRIQQTHQSIVEAVWIADRSDQVVRTVPEMAVARAIDDGRVNRDQPLGPRGDAIYSTSHGPVPGGLSDPWQRAGAPVGHSGSSVYWTDVYPTRESGHPGVTAWLPLADGHTLVGADISIIELTAQQLSPSISGEPQAYTLLLSSSNTVLGGGPGVEKDFGLPPGGSVGAQLPLQRGTPLGDGLLDVESNGRATRITATLAGTDKQLFTEPILSAHWILATAVPVSDLEPDVSGLTRGIQTGIARILTTAIPVGLILCLLAFLLATLMARRLVGPVGALTHAAERLGEGRMDEEVAPQGADELGRLAVSLERMRREVNGSRDALLAASRELEQRVTERTAELRDRNEELIALNLLAGTLTRSLDPEAILGGVLDTLPAFVPLRAAAGYLVTPQGLRATGGRGRHRPRLAAIARRAVDGGEVIVESSGRGSLVGVPLSAAGEVLGAIGLTAAWSEPPERTLQLLRAVADQSGLALRTAKLSREGRELAVLGERTRLAREIHDTIAQQLTAIVLQLEAAEAFLSRQDPRAAEVVVAARDLSRSALREARRSVWDLRPEPLEATGLVAALALEAQRWQGRTGVPVRLSTDGMRTPPALSPQAEVTAYRIVQEALANIGRHSRAKWVEIRLDQDDDGLVLTIGDDGVGFTPNGNGGPPGSFGLVGMAERARQSGGSFDVESAPGEGTRIRVRLPLEDRAATGARA